MAAEFIFYTIMCVVLVGYIVVMHFIKRNETTNRGYAWESPGRTRSLVLIRGNDGGPHHDLPVSAAGCQHGSAAGLEPAVQSAFFSRSGASARPTLLQSRVSYRVVVASKCQRNAVAIYGRLTNCIISFSLNVEFGVMVLTGPLLGPALAIRAVCRAGIICAA